MATQDKTLLMHKVEGTLRPRMFANLLEEAVSEIQDHMDEFDIKHLDDGGVVDGDDMLNAFIASKRNSGRSEKTLVRYRYIIERFMKSVGVKTRDITVHHVRDYLSREKQRGISDSTLEGHREVLSSYFGWLDQEKMIHMNPLKNIEVIKTQKKLRKGLSPVDLKKIERVCTNKRDVAIINFLLSTGCRVGEVVQLNKSDVDLDAGELKVLGKGNKERTVYLNDVAIMTLREYLASRNDKCDALFVGSRLERFQSGGIRLMLKRVAEMSGVDNVHPHRFRRTMITRLLNNGMPIHEVALLVGHDKIDTTMQYFQMDKGRIKSSFNRYY